MHTYGAGVTYNYSFTDVATLSHVYYIFHISSLSVLYLFITSIVAITMISALSRYFLLLVAHVPCTSVQTR